MSRFITSIDHVNLRAPRDMMHKLKAFYCNVLGLLEGPREGFTSYGFWLYCGEQAVVHLSEYRGEGVPLTHVTTTFDHVSFSCADADVMETQLKAHQIDYSIRIIERLAIKQFNFKDPAGNGVELSCPLAPVQPAKL